MAIQVTLAPVSDVLALTNPEVRSALHKAHLAFRIGQIQRSFEYLNEAQRLIKASLPIDYTPKSLVEGFDDEPTFGQQPPKQEVDLEDYQVEFTSTYWSFRTPFRGKPDQSKSKAKWARSGRQARRLSNRV